VKERKVEQKKKEQKKQHRQKENRQSQQKIVGKKNTRTSRTNQVNAGKQDNTVHRQNSRKTPPQHASVPSSDPFQGFHFGFRGGQFLFVKIRVMHVFVR
jgi:hypothetical protein